jgi:hypothetical protein
VTAEATKFDPLTGTSELLNHPQFLKYRTDIVWNPKVWPLEMVVFPRWLPPRVEIEAIVR